MAIHSLDKVTQSCQHLIDHDPKSCRVAGFRKCGLSTRAPRSRPTQISASSRGLPAPLGHGRCLEIFCLLKIPRSQRLSSAERLRCRLPLSVTVATGGCSVCRWCLLQPAFPLLADLLCQVISDLLHLTTADPQTLIFSRQQKSPTCLFFVRIRF